MEDRQYSPEEVQAMLRQMGWGEPEPVPQPPQISREDAKIVADFEQFPSMYTVLSGKQPGRPRSKMSEEQKRWPRMVYQALRNPRTGKWATELDRPSRYHFRDENEYNMAYLEYDQFARQCQRIVGSEREYEAALKEGWRDSAAEALTFRENEHLEAGQAAAERAYKVARMSEAAQAEVAQAEAEHYGHLIEIPEKKRRGRPRKVAQTPEA